MLCFFTNLRLMELQVSYLALFLLFSVIGGFGLFWIGNLHKNTQLILVFLKGLFLVLHVLFLVLSDLWQQLELASELESDLRDTVDWGRRWPFFFFFFFNCYLAAPRPTSGHYRGDSLTHPMLITAFLHIRPEGHWEPRSEVGSLSPAERLVGFEPGTFRF